MKNKNAKKEIKKQTKKEVKKIVKKETKKEVKRQTKYVSKKIDYKFAAKAPETKPAVKQTVQPAAKPVAQLAAKPAVLPLAKPLVQPAALPVAQPVVQPAVQPTAKKQELSKLPYAYNALEPYMDEATVRLHHDKHHQTYVDNLNLALDKHPELCAIELGKLLADLNKVPEDIRIQVRNHGGGVWNHNMFWQVLKKDVKVPKEIGDALSKDLGGFDKFKEEFKKAALGQFGSGWAWLVLNKGKLEIIKLPNQDNPLCMGMIPLLTIDVWEHSYYLKYQNRRAEYADNFFNIINWEEVNRRYLEAKKAKLI